MKIFAVALVLLLPACAADAQSRPSTTTMSCAAAQGLVLSRHAIVLNTGRDLYDRYVADQGQCPTGLVATPAFAPTLDNPQCFVGSLCVTISRDDR